MLEREQREEREKGGRKTEDEDNNVTEENETGRTEREFSWEHYCNPGWPIRFY